MGIKYNPLIFNGFDVTGGNSGVSIGDPIAGSTPNSILVTDSSGNLDEVTLTPNRAVASGVDGLPVSSLTTAAELGFVSGVTSAIQTQLNNKANRSLNNLASTAVNTAINPDVDATHSLGIPSLTWNSVYSTFYRGAGVDAYIAISGAATGLYDDTGLQAIRWNSRRLDDATGAEALNWATSNINIVGSRKITNVLNPTAAQDVATKNYVDSLANGLSWRAPALVATTANITLSGEQTIDGVLTSASRVLVKDQSTPAQNGIYVSAAGAWTRSTDMDTWLEVPASALFIQQGTVNSDKAFVCTSDAGGTLGVTAITFVQFSSVIYTADGLGIELVGNQFQLELDSTTLSKSASGLKVATSGITDNEISASASIQRSKLLTGGAYRIIVNGPAGVMNEAGLITGNRALVGDANGVPAASVTTTTELSYVNGVTSAIQTQLNGKASTTLNNLGTTSINADLLPSGDLTRNIGSNILRFFQGYIATLNTSDGSAAISTEIRQLNVGGNTVLDWSGANPSLNSHKLINVTDPTLAQDAATKNYVDTQISGISTSGDIAHTSFTGANNVAAPANVTGLAFANGTVRSFEALVSTTVIATANLYEVFKIRGIQKGADWDISIESTGDDSNVDFSITTAGQIQYTSANYTGFASLTMKFRAIVTTV